MAKKHLKLVLSNLPPLEDIDVSVLSMTQLLDFCVRVGTEMGKEKNECQELELEINKLKVLTNIDGVSQYRSTTSTILSEYQLESQMLNNTQVDIEIGRNQKNVSRENAQQVVHKLSSSAQNLKNLSQEFYKSKLEIELDVDTLKKSYQENNITFNTNYIKSQFTLSENNSKVKDKLLLYRNIFSMSEETLRCISEKHLRVLTNFEMYKNKEVQGYLKQHNRQSTQLKHYYERTVRHNTKNRTQKLRMNFTKSSKKQRLHILLLRTK